MRIWVSGTKMEFYVGLRLVEVTVVGPGWMVVESGPITSSDSNLIPHCDQTLNSL